MSWIAVRRRRTGNGLCHLHTPADKLDTVHSYSICRKKDERPVTLHEPFRQPAGSEK
jgi:hypothetical protein